MPDSPNGPARPISRPMSQLEKDKERILRQEGRIKPLLDRVKAAQASLEADGYDVLSSANPGAKATGETNSARATSSLHLTPELTYRRGGEHKFFTDVAKAKANNDLGARQRLAQHDRETRADYGKYPKAEAAAKWAAEQRDVGAGAGTGAEFLPPRWMYSAWAGVARTLRPFADSWIREALPAGISSIQIPRATTGVSVAVQTATLAADSKTDLITASTSVPVISVAGQEDMALQVLEQGAYSEQLLYSDLLADLNSKIDNQCLNGSGSSGQALGILNVAGIQATTYTDATPKTYLLQSRMASSMGVIGVNRKLMADSIVMTPSRWVWMMSQLDAQNRPMLTPSAPPYVDSETAPDPDGYLLGLPVYTDANLPSNLGAGTNQDIIVIYRGADCYLWEAPEPRVKVMLDVLSNTLEARVQMATFVALSAARYPSGVATVGGTGLVAAVWA